jgi:hypothetical protein
VALIAPYFEVRDFPVFTGQENLHGPAADFTINRESLLGEAGVHGEFEFLPTKWTLDGFRFLHLPDELKAITVRVVRMSPKQRLSNGWHIPCSRYWWLTLYE